MPRGTRILLENACYHIINRGNQKENIFLTANDFKKFLELLKHYKRVFAFKLFGYCLMPNHIHLILQPKHPQDLVKIMQGISQTYAFWFNKTYKKSGHLWQGRFKSRIVHKDSYFFECVYYVEVNPVRASLVSSPGDYPWSSYRDRIFENKNTLLDIPDST